MKTSLSVKQEFLDDLSYDQVQAAFTKTCFFKDKTWKYSPEAFKLSDDQLLAIKKIGQACHQFLQGLEVLYTRSREQKSILRNQDLLTDWVAAYYDSGKPERLLKHATHRVLKKQSPVVLRPDLLIAENGLSLTEIDAVPGGVGLTCFLSTFYNSQNVLGEDMLQCFYEAVASTDPKNTDPFIAIVVSDESEDYRPEFQWLSEQLKELGKSIEVYHPDDLEFRTDGVYACLDGRLQKIDIVYRFFELFDLPEISQAEALMDAVEAGKLQLTPPMRPFQEEKLSLALLHHHLLEGFWQESLGEEIFEFLRQIIPNSWVLDPAPVPPTAALQGPAVVGKAMHSWQELSKLSQKKRNLIIKASGFDETAWGARSVTLGSDVSSEKWTEAVHEALGRKGNPYYVLQDYHKPVLQKHCLFEPSNQSVLHVDGRVRLCPYYFVNKGIAKVSGILATFCPSDKKIIHGMSDAALLPCKVV